MYIYIYIYKYKYMQKYAKIMKQILQDKKKL